MRHETKNIAGTSMVDLDDLLEKERTALLQGDLDQVSTLLEAKEVLFAQIGSLTARPADGLRSLQAKVKRNQLLLDGALDGIRTVAERMKALRQAEKSLDTYGSDGLKKQIIMNGRHSVERRA